MSCLSRRIARTRCWLPYLSCVCLSRAEGLVELQCEPSFGSICPRPDDTKWTPTDHETTLRLNGAEQWYLLRIIAIHSFAQGSFDMRYARRRPPCCRPLPLLHLPYCLLLRTLASNRYQGHAEGQGQQSSFIATNRLASLRTSELAPWE